MNASCGHPVSIDNLRQAHALLAAKGKPLLLDACRLLENAYWNQQRSDAFRNQPIAAIVRATCDASDGASLSAMKDFLVREGGFIALRDEATFRRARMLAFREGTQPSTPALASMRVALEEMSEAHIASRVQQVVRFWTRLVELGVPVVRPVSGHAVFIDAREFLPPLSDQDTLPAESLAAYLFERSGIRVGKVPPTGAVPPLELLRLAVPARRYLDAHLDYAANEIGRAYENRASIPRLKRQGPPEIGIPARFVRL